MQSLVIRLGLAGLTASAMIALIPSGGAAAAEPLPAGTYEVVLPDGAVSFEVFYDGAVRVLSSPDGLEVTFRFDDDVKVLDEFSISSPEGDYEVDIDVDEAGGGYAYEVETLAPPQTATDDASDGDSSGQEQDSAKDDDGSEVTDEDRGRPSDLPAPRACEVSQGQAPEKNPNCPDATEPEADATDADAQDEDVTSPPGRSETRGQGSGGGGAVSRGRR